MRVRHPHRPGSDRVGTSRRASRSSRRTCRRARRRTRCPRRPATAGGNTSPALPAGPDGGDPSWLPRRCIAAPPWGHGRRNPSWNAATRSSATSRLLLEHGLDPSIDIGVPHDGGDRRCQRTFDRSGRRDHSRSVRPGCHRRRQHAWSRSQAGDSETGTGPGRPRAGPCREASDTGCPGWSHAIRRRMHASEATIGQVANEQAALLVQCAPHGPGNMVRCRKAHPPVTGDVRDDRVQVRPAVASRARSPPAPAPGKRCGRRRSSVLAPHALQQFVVEQPNVDRGARHTAPTSPTPRRPVRAATRHPHDSGSARSRCRARSPIRSRRPRAGPPTLRTAPCGQRRALGNVTTPPSWRRSRPARSPARHRLRVRPGSAAGTRQVTIAGRHDDRLAPAMTVSVRICNMVVLGRDAVALVQQLVDRSEAFRRALVDEQITAIRSVSMPWWRSSRPDRRRR